MFGIPPPPENRAVYEIMVEDMVELGRPQITIKKTTHTLSTLDD